MTDTIWSDEPPTEPGWYWVRYKAIGEVSPTLLLARDWNPWLARCDLRSVSDMQTNFQFGPRVPDAETCAGIMKGDK